MGSLTVALIERGKIVISKGATEAVDFGISFVIKGEVEGIVVNSLVEVHVSELKIIVDSVIVDGCTSSSIFGEGKNVKLFNGASGFVDVEEKP